MARCIACDKQINFGDDLCKKCSDAVASVYKDTAEDITTIEQMMYSVRNPRLLDDYMFDNNECTTTSKEEDY